MRAGRPPKEERPLTALGERIAAAAEHAGLSPTKLGENAGLGRGHISRLMYETRDHVSADVLRRIAGAAKVSIEWFQEDADRENPDTGLVRGVAKHYMATLAGAPTGRFPNLEAYLYVHRKHLRWSPWTIAAALTGWYDADLDDPVAWEGRLDALEAELARLRGQPGRRQGHAKGRDRNLSE